MTPKAENAWLFSYVRHSIDLNLTPFEVSFSRWFCPILPEKWNIFPIVLHADVVNNMKMPSTPPFIPTIWLFMHTIPSLAYVTWPLLQLPIIIEHHWSLQDKLGICPPIADVSANNPQNSSNRNFTAIIISNWLQLFLIRSYIDHSSNLRGK